MARPSRQRLFAAAVLVPVAIAASVPSLAPAKTKARKWFVLAGAKEGGKGTRKAPFDRLQTVEERSRPGDLIIVLSAPRATRPLDGGIRLKAGQRLIGEHASGGAPRLANTGRSRLDGDAVRLADRTTVRGVEISAAARGGIYGDNVNWVTIRDNDVTHHNTSCTRGFHIPRFNVPTIVPGAGIPISDGLHNGWAGVMVDASRGKRAVTIRGNRVHHSECGDGIDVRASGSARMRATISRNETDHLRQGEELESVLAIGLQTRDGADLVATVEGNRQHDLGNEEDPGLPLTGADSEGVFVNPTGRSSLRATVVRNSYTHARGHGGFSANGLEFVSMGNGARGHLSVRDSTFSGTPGDVLEQLALGTNAYLAMELERVVATRSTGFGETGYGNTVLIPGNNADCLISASGGAGNTVELSVRHSELTGCANNGITFGSAVANGSGPTAALRAHIADSQITGNHGGNLRVGNVAGLERLAVKVERTNLADSRALGSGLANASFEDLGTTRHAVIDLGGGGLGSSGGNCLHDGTLGAELLRYDVTARRNWWGTPGGPFPGRVVAVGGTLDWSPGLDGRPGYC